MMFFFQKMQAIYPMLANQSWFDAKRVKEVVCAKIGISTTQENGKSRLQVDKLFSTILQVLFGCLCDWPFSSGISVVYHLI